MLKAANNGHYTELAELMEESGYMAGRAVLLGITDPRLAGFIAKMCEGCRDSDERARVAVTAMAVHHLLEMAARDG